MFAIISFGLFFAEKEFLYNIVTATAERMRMLSFISRSCLMEGTMDCSSCLLASTYMPCHIHVCTHMHKTHTVLSGDTLVTSERIHIKMDI